MNRRLLLSIGSAIGISGTTVGGIFLDRHIKENNFLFQADEGAIRLEQKNSELGIKFARSTHPDDFWRILWIFEVIRHIDWNIKNFTEKGKQEKEESFWNYLLTNYKKLPITGEEKSNIENKYTNYWEKFKWSCLKFQAKKNASDQEVNENACVILGDLRDPSKYSEKYFWYDEAKNSKMDIDEFIWTKVWQFRSTDEYISGSNKTQENKEKFRNWLISNNSKITAK